MQIDKDNVVAFNYNLTVDGQLVDSSEGGDPLAYLHGHGNIVSGLESELAGKAVGDHVEATIPPAEGYGDYDQNLLVGIPLDAFPEDDREQLQPGVRFQGPHPQDQQQAALYTISQVEEDHVVADANHPLAGKTLDFAVDIVEVREATAEELEHGHVHGPGGHQH